MQLNLLLSKKGYGSYYYFYLEYWTLGDLFFDADLRNWSFELTNSCTFRCLINNILILSTILSVCAKRFSVWNKSGNFSREMTCCARRKVLCWDLERRRFLAQCQVPCRSSWAYEWGFFFFWYRALLLKEFKHYTRPLHKNAHSRNPTEWKEIKCSTRRITIMK